MNQWRNFDVDLFDYEKVGESESVRVRVSRSPAGEQRDATRVDIPPALKGKLKQLADDQATLQTTIEIGHHLADILFAGTGATLFEKSRAGLSDDEGLRLRIELRAMALAEFPWEYLHWHGDVIDEQAPERGFLGLNRSISITRYEAVSEAARACAPLDNKPIQIAMLLANPTVPGWPALNLDHEASVVAQALEGEEGLRLSVNEHADEAALNTALDNKPHVLHFSGHGQFKIQPTDQFGVYEGQGQLLFETADGKVNAVSANELARKTRGAGVRLAILNCCESARRDVQSAFTGIAPTLIRDGTPAVVAMQFSVRDSQALLFAERLYKNLAAHGSIDSAVTAARLAMFDGASQYFRDWGIPVLYLRSNESVLFPDETQTNLSRSPVLNTRVAVNLLLSTVVVFALAFVYLRHIEPRLPLGSLVGGVMAVALALSVSYLMTVGGETVRLLLMRWFNQKKAFFILAIALAAIVVPTLLMPPPLALRVVAGPSLMGRLPAPELAELPVSYQLAVSTSSGEAIEQDFRKNGLIVAGGRSLARRLSRRHSDDIEKFADAFLRNNPQIAQQEQFKRAWTAPASQLALRGLGSAERLTLRLHLNGELKACKSIDKADFTQTMSVIVLEMRDECNS